MKSSLLTCWQSWLIKMKSSKIFETELVDLLTNLTYQKLHTNIFDHKDMKSYKWLTWQQLLRKQYHFFTWPQTCWRVDNIDMEKSEPTVFLNTGCWLVDKFDNSKFKTKIIWPRIKEIKTQLTRQWCLKNNMPRL